MQTRDDPRTEPEALTSAQWRELDECAGRLEATLLAGNASVDLALYLPRPGTPHRLATLHELIKIELEARYRRGDRCLLEDYVLRYPELGGPEKLPASLLYEEYLDRLRFSERPVLDEYRDRFPLQFEELQRLAQQTINAQNDALPLQYLVGYKKLELLGRGEFGEVWKALAPGGVEVALKFIVRTIDRELEALEEIKRLRHSHLLQIHSFGRMEGKLTIVMELADMSLSDRYAQCQEQDGGHIPKEWLLNYFKQAAAALDYLRCQHVSHCDIKPQNLLIQQGLAKVADFGLARAQDNRVEPVSALIGSPHYIAPEVWQQQVSSNSDQYSLAATYVHMRLGRPLFSGNFQGVREQHLNQEPNLNPLPLAEQAVLRIALAKEADHRFPSCEAFTRALEDAMLPPTPPTPLITPPPPAHVGMIIALASVVFVLIAIIITNRAPPSEKPSWQPEGWEPEGGRIMVKDSDGRLFFPRLIRQVGGQKVVIVAVPRMNPSDPPTFYMMENKVWNDLYGVFFPKSGALFEKYGSRPGCDLLVSNEPFWKLSAISEDFKSDPDNPPLYWVDGANGRLPVFRVTVTEAHCFAEWLGGSHARLPSAQEWRKAAEIEDGRPGQLTSRAGDKKDLAIGLPGDGPWPVDMGNHDVGRYGCRQMFSNGLEWTRDLHNDPATIPLASMTWPPSVYLVGQLYQSPALPKSSDLNELRTLDCTKRHLGVSFRVVLEE